MRLITLSLFATLLSAPAFAADLGTYRPGTPYSSAVAGGADVCESHCAGDAQCRGWNYVKPNPRGAGICEFLSSVSTPISSPVSISGESQASLSYSSRVKPGGTNTVRVGTQVTPVNNAVSLGQARPRRTVVRRAQPDLITPQKTSTRPVENLSLTEQQNRYRQAQGFAAPSAPQPNQRVVPQQQAFARPQRPNFRPILEGTSPQISAQQFGQQPQAQPVQRQASRRVTGARGQGGAQAPAYQAQGFHSQGFQAPGYAAPQFQDPRVQGQNFQGQNPQGQNYPGQNFSNQNVQGQNIQGQNFRGQPYPAQPQQGQPYSGQPQQGQPFQAPQAQPQQFTQQQAPRRGSSKPPVGQPIPAPQQAVRPTPSTPGQRLAQLTAQTRTQPFEAFANGPAGLSPEQARQSLFGSLNDDIPTASAVPTQPVTSQPLNEVLAGGR